MDNEMSAKTRQEVLARLRRCYARAGRKYKARLLDQAIELFGYHRKAAVRALGLKTRSGKARAVPAIIGRPREYSPEVLLTVLKPIWFAAYQPCGRRLAALLPEWLPAYEQDHRRLEGNVRELLLAASARTLDRLIAPLRAGNSRRCGTKPGSLLRQSIPIRGDWNEEGPGWLEMDTVALCGGRLDDRHSWMVDAVDICTAWTELRATENRSQRCVLQQVQDMEQSLPFELLGVDMDNGGEFINHHMVRYFQLRPKPVLMTRARPYRKNDNAHVEQRNWTHVRQHFGYERYDSAQAVQLINALCKGALGLLLNHFLPTQKLVGKRREGQRTVRQYGAPQTPYGRVMAAAQVSAAKKAELKKLHEQLNPMALARQIEHEKRQINQCRLIAP